MERYRVLFNPNASNGRGLEIAKHLEGLLATARVRFSDMTAIDSYPDFIAGLEEDERLVVTGGDGTLNRFVNDMAAPDLQRDIYYYAAGSGNDFLRDVEQPADGAPFLLTPYLQHLPEAEVGGRRYRFINGVGTGLDGYVCAEVERQKQERGKKANYAGLALKGLLYAYRPADVAVTVDGVRREYESAWLAPTMNGRYLGGGIMLAPTQDRLNAEHTVSAMVLATPSRLKTLTVFPSVFSGKHLRFTDVVTVVKGHRIEVEFDRPVDMQIDGDTLPGITKYTVRSAAAIAKDAALTK